MLQPLEVLTSWSLRREIRDGYETKMRVLEAPKSFSKIGEVGCLIANAFQSQGKLLIAANGGSAADA